jgi:hypothetical protein
VFLVNGGPLIAFMILYALDFFALAKAGVYNKGDSPIGTLIFILLFAVAGIPYALIKRRRDVKFYRDEGGAPLGGRYTFFNVAFAAVIGLWGLLLLCGVFSLVYVSTHPELRA